jgi:hypothetical protein
LTILVSWQLNQIFYSIYLKETHNNINKYEFISLIWPKFKLQQSFGEYRTNCPRVVLMITSVYCCKNSRLGRRTSGSLTKLSGICQSLGQLYLKIARHLKIANRKTEFGVVSITIQRFPGNFLHQDNTNMKLRSGNFFSQSKSFIY